MLSGHARDLGGLTETAGYNIKAASPIHFPDADEAYHEALSKPREGEDLKMSEAEAEDHETSEAEDHETSEAEDHETSEAEDYETSGAEDHETSEAEDYEMSEAEAEDHQASGAEDHETSEAEDYEMSEAEELATIVRACAERARRAIKAQRKQTTLADLVAQADTDALLIAQFKAVRIAKVCAAGGTIVTLLRCLRLISTNNSKLKQRRRLLLMLLGQRNPTLLLRNYLPKVKQAELHMLVAKLGS